MSPHGGFFSKQKCVPPWVFISLKSPAAALSSVNQAYSYRRDKALSLPLVGRQSIRGMVLIVY